MELELHNLEFKILQCQNPEFTILECHSTCQNLEFKKKKMWITSVATISKVLCTSKVASATRT